MPSRPPTTVTPLTVMSFPRMKTACGDGAGLPGCWIVVFFWPSSVIRTMSGGKLTCSLHVPLTITVSPGLTLSSAALILLPASQSTEIVAAFATSAEKQRPARNAAVPVLT